MPVDPLDRAAALHERALNLHDAGKLAAADRAATEAKRLFAKHSGAAHPDVASALDTLAMIALSRGETRKAVKLLERAVAILDRYPRVKEVRPFRAQSLGRLGDALRELGDYPSARAVLQRATTATRGAYGAGSLEHAAALNRFGVLCKFAGWFADGHRAYTTAAAMIDGHEGSDDLECALLHNLGGLEHARDRFEEAERYARRGYDKRVALHGDESLAALEDLGALAVIVADLGRHSEAEAMLRSVLSHFEARFGVRHVEVAIVLHNLGAVAASSGRHAEAERLYRRALSIQRAKLGATHPEVALCMHNLAVVLDALARHREALALHRRALSVARRALGAKHPTTRASHSAALDAERRAKRAKA